MIYARVDNGIIAEVILPYFRTEDMRPPAPDALPDNASPSDIAAHDAQQASHDDFVVGEVPIDQRFTPELVAQMVDITNINPLPQAGWVYDGTTFSPYVPPAPTAAQILATNTATRNQYLAAATLAIGPLQDAVDIGEATSADTAMLTAWKTFRVAVNRVVLTVQNPTWPTPPQPGYGAAIAQPVSSS